MNLFDEIVEIMHRLRHECPWDREQTLETLRSYLLEEAYECVAAINEREQHGVEELIEELGDVLLQVLFQAEILSEQLKRPVIEDVIQALRAKLVRRHPHVFGDVKTDDADFVLKQWHEIKRQERPRSESVLPKIKKGLTALQTSHEIGKASQKVAFDWNSPDEVWLQVKREEAELLEAPSPSEQEREFGDLIFSLVQWARHKGFDAEVAVAWANRKFETRFQRMETILNKRKQQFSSLSPQEKEALWQEAKAFEKSNPKGLA